MKGYDPLADRDMGRFHDGPDGHGERFPASCDRTLIEAVPVRFAVDRPPSLMTAMGTDWDTIGPKDFLNVSAGFFLSQLADFD